MLKQSFYSVPTRFQRQSKIMQRRSFIIGAATLTALTVAGPVRSLEGKTKMNNLEKWDKTFPQDDRVEHKKVSFYTRFGTRLIGNLYCPKGVSGDLPAIAVCGPFGAVKEQASGLYAQTLAANGFVTLAFDPSFTGESSGFPRNLASPDISTEDFSAAVESQGRRPQQDRGARHLRIRRFCIERRCNRHPHQSYRHLHYVRHEPCEHLWLFRQDG